MDSNLYDPNKILFHIHKNAITSVHEACKARLDLFDIPGIMEYTKILYLDIDILIRGSIPKMFDVIEKDDLLYVVEEGDISHPWWGGELWKELPEPRPPIRTTFTTGIMGFTPSPKIRTLFETVKDHMKRDPRQLATHDQPFLVLNAYMMDMYDNQVLRPFVINDPKALDTPHHIRHYCGGPGTFGWKKERMLSELTVFKDEHIVKTVDAEGWDIVQSTLLPIIHGLGESLEGNVYTLHNTTQHTNHYLAKRQNIISLFTLLRRLREKTGPLHVLEIGFNAGFSTLLMLLSHPYVHVTCLDICMHKYTKPCFEALKKKFGSRLALMEGSSVDRLPDLVQPFDVIHIDGGHQDPIVENDSKHALRLSKKGTILIMDDYDFKNIRGIWDRYCQEHPLQPLSSHIFTTNMQDIRILN